MPNQAVATMLVTLRENRLLGAEQLAELGRLPGCFADARTLAEELQRREWLTPYQAAQLLQGRGHELVLGPFFLLEPLGQGGVSHVFKARRSPQEPPVTLKVLRAKSAQQPEVLRGFSQEIQALTQLDHPHIVRAYEAGQFEGIPYLVMEYVEGIDLARLVQKYGPLPAGTACRFVRQAALGLQHAFERGLVHRDIKPANLLLAAESFTIKILDLGLVRLDSPGLQQSPVTGTSRTVWVLGTPDYIAPEQVLDPYQADIRADLYGLGGTLYYLLTGQPPFPDGSPEDKLLCHLQAEPVPVEEQRPDVPQGLTALVRQLLAKRPEDRPQTPEEVAQVLEPLAEAGGSFVLLVDGEGLDSLDPGQATVHLHEPTS